MNKVGKFFLATTCLLLTLSVPPRASAQAVVVPSGGGPGQSAAAETYGANPSASAAVNTSALQSALNNTGLITLNQCPLAGVNNFQINAPLVISSNTTFRRSECARIQQASGTNSNLIVNKAYTNRGLMEGVVQDDAG